MILSQNINKMKHELQTFGTFGAANPFADLDQFDAIQNPNETPRETEHEELKQRTIEWYLARWENSPDQTYLI